MDGLVLAAPVYWYTFPRRLVIVDCHPASTTMKFPAGILCRAYHSAAPSSLGGHVPTASSRHQDRPCWPSANVGEVLIPGVYGAGDFTTVRAPCLADKLCPVVADSHAGHETATR